MSVNGCCVIFDYQYSSSYCCVVTLTLNVTDVIADDVVQLFSRESGPVDSRQRILSEFAPFVIKNETDLKLQITFGEFYQVTLPDMSLSCPVSAVDSAQLTILPAVGREMSSRLLPVGRRSSLVD